MPSVTYHPSAIPDYIDHAADIEPDGIFAIVPASTSEGNHEWLHLTFAVLAKAINQVAWWIETTVGVGQAYEVLDYMGANDLRYPILIAAALKAGYTPMLTSPRNSVEGQQSLLQNTKCRKIIYTSDIESQVKEIQHAVPELQVFAAPSLADLMHPQSERQPYVGRHQTEEDAVCLILHTSGSTGLPKPIRLTIGGLRTADALASLPSEDGCQQASELFLGDRRPLLTAVPFFHAMGLICLVRSIMRLGTIIRVPTGRVLNASLVIEVIDATRPVSGIFPPSILEDLSATDEGLNALSKLESVFYGGGPLALESGNKISKVCRVVSVIGSTEAGFYATLVSSAGEDWPYFKWSSAAGVHMEPAEEGLREMVVKRQDLAYQGIFHTFPELEEWRTKDLFEENASKPGLWKYRGRLDDVVVLSNGEKFNPVSSEKLIEGHPLVKGALVVGQGRFQAGLIIEPEWARAGPKDFDDTLIDDIWPLVEKANSEAPGHARIYKSKIAIAKRDKPFKRAAKTSIIRLATNTLYAPEIDALYSNEALTEQLGSLDPHARSEVIVEFLKKAFLATIPSFNKDTSNDADIFSLGADSLGVLSLATAINHALPKTSTTTARIIYENPSVSKLASSLATLLHGNEQMNGYQSREDKIDALVKKYTVDIPDEKLLAPPTVPSKRIVILTGSTGSLGNYTLELLLQRPDVEKVYCMNRSNSAEARQQASFSNRGASLSNFHKAIFLQSDFSKDRFGLSEEMYAELRQSITHIIHSAWSVDFNLALESYEATHIAGTRSLIDFSASATYHPSIAFISSIASMGNWSASFSATRPVPESLGTIFDNSLPLAQGYGESKHVASQILAVASRRLGIRSAIIRAGQLAGPSEEYAKAHGGLGIWNRHEWLPTIVKTSRSLGKIPGTLGTQERVDWVPMDKAATMVMDVALGSGDEADCERADSPVGTDASGAENDDTHCGVFHLVNPKTTTWSSFVPTIQAFFHDTSEVELKTVEYGAWLDGLKEIGITKENMEAFPALKLLEFYEGLRPGESQNGREGSGGLPILDTKTAEKWSGTLRGLQAVGEGEMRIWLEGWAF